MVDGKIIVLERGQLTRLHDLDGDGEADFYENVSNDWNTGSGEHSYDTCLETDPEGNFYFFKAGDTHLPEGGCLLRVSRDGSKTEVFATGFRHPIGLSISPAGVITGADQEGNWMPATRIDIYHKGGFYGDMRRITAPCRRRPTIHRCCGCQRSPTTPPAGRRGCRTIASACRRVSCCTSPTDDAGSLPSCRRRWAT